jgi:hypothetical protein
MRLKYINWYNPFTRRGTQQQVDDPTRYGNKESRVREHGRYKLNLTNAALIILVPALQHKGVQGNVEQQLSKRFLYQGVHGRAAFAHLQAQAEAV